MANLQQNMLYHHVSQPHGIIIIVDIEIQEQVVILYFDGTM